MYSSMQNKSKNKLNSQPIKKQRLKPQWTTDFVDRQQFKLSESQRIQKKASLQSKHRQDARRQLEERRKKLEMGIIDEQTRKVYETALLSKNIDINPPLRRNLTEMIRYEKQQKGKTSANEDQYYGSDNQEQFDEFQQQEQELKEAQNFIKKFQRAKKQDKIQRAVQILSNNKSLEKQKKMAQTNQGETKMNNFMGNRSNENTLTNKSTSYNQKALNKSQSFSQDDALSSIEDTIRFMEQKLFAAKKSVEEHSRSFISQANESFDSQNSAMFNRRDQKQTAIPEQPTFKKAKKSDQQVQIKFKTQNNFLPQDDLQFGQRIGQISQLRINLKEQNPSSDDECLDTIRRMREMMQNKQTDGQSYDLKKVKLNQKNNPSPSVGTLGFNSTISKRSYQSVLDSEAEVSFNLTVNNDDQYQQENSIFNISKSKFRAPDLGIKHQGEQINFAKKKDLEPLKKEQQDQYEDEYQKIKQNLFSCLSSNDDEHQDKRTNNPLVNKKVSSFTKFDEDEEDDESDDSLMVRDKINSWKKELQHQIDPEEQEQDDSVHFKTTNFNKNYNKKSEIVQIKNLVHQQEDDLEQDDQPYRYNYFSGKNENKNSLNKFEQSFKQTNSFYPPKTQAQYINKPPMAKKNQNTQKFEEMKKMISNASSQIQKISIQPLKIQPLSGKGEVLGFDFRGSINIKKNILSK